MRLGWRLHCRQNRIDDARARLDSLDDQQGRDLLLWDQLTGSAATDSIEDLIAAALKGDRRHG